MDEEDMGDKEEQSEESRVVRVGQRKKMSPTLAGREEHERTHVPYGSLCRLCRCTGGQFRSSRLEMYRGG